MPVSRLEKIRYSLRNAFSDWEERALREGKSMLKAALETAGNGV